jgi:hypothetical protein
MLCHLRGESVDRRSRFAIKFENENILTHCFNCRFKATFSPNKTLSKNFQIFLNELGIPKYDIDKINFELYKTQSNIKAAEQIKLKGATTASWKTVKLPSESQSLMTWLENGCNDVNFLKVVEYAIARKFTNLHDLYWTPTVSKFEYEQRLVLPFYYRGKLVGYTGRFADNTITTSALRPKYINTMPDHYVYNLDHQSAYERKYVILCEGVFDAYFTDGICAIGNTLHEEQIAMINRLGKTIIVCPDKDKDGGALVKHAIANGWGVCFPRWGDDIKDAAKAVETFGRILTVQSILDSVEFNPITIELTWKLTKKTGNSNGRNSSSKGL